jgi:integrase/recombinase XerD
LLDTGARAAEFTSMQLQDLNVVTGSILIRVGKGRKPRTVFLGKRTRKAVRAYLKHRNDDCPYLWVTRTRSKLTYSGLRQIIRRRAFDANVEIPGIHDFRRAFAINMLRNGTDLITLSRLMGHADLQVLRRYLAQTDKDIQDAHHRAGPVDHAEW